jgi:Mg2+-importing ATPase
VYPLSKLRASLETGDASLTTAEARQRLKRFGPNRFRERAERPLVLQFLSRFRNPLVIVLLAASGASALTGDATDFVIISVIVLASITLDFVQEHRANRASERLRHSVAVRATVRWLRSYRVISRCSPPGISYPPTDEWWRRTTSS